jgi:hypothetical protein
METMFFRIMTMPPGKSQGWRYSAVLLVLIGLLGCGNLAKTGIGTTNIGDIQVKWDSPLPIYLKGRVSKQVPLLGIRAYELQDATGTIWVLTEAPDPQPGDEVVIKGKIRYQSIPLAGKDIGTAYIEQQEQLESTSAQPSIAPTSALRY